MADSRSLTQQLLEKEAEAWRDLPPAEYDHVLCGMFDDVSDVPHSAEQVDALLALASETLRRNEPTLTESRFRCVESLLALVSSVSELALFLRISPLFLLAWLRLGAVVERGPESISVTPSLPPGVVLPDGADPAAIGEPALNEQAREAAMRHDEAVERWNAKQRALGHLHRLASLVRSARVIFKDEKNLTKELVAAMSLAPGLPSALRRLLEKNPR